MHIIINKYIFLLIIFLVSACYQEQEKSVSSADGKAIIPVKAEILKEQEYEVIIEGIGKIDSRQRATLIFESQGQLEKIYKKLGDEIIRGEVKPFGTSAHVNITRKHIGKKTITLIIKK